MKRTDRTKDDTHSVVGDGSGCGERDVWRSTALYQAPNAYIIRVSRARAFLFPDSLHILQQSTTYHVLLKGYIHEQFHSRTTFQVRFPI
jgi:hypothetical protein